jgi:hypothetical protein
MTVSCQAEKYESAAVIQEAFRPLSEKKAGFCF